MKKASLPKGIRLSKGSYEARKTVNGVSICLHNKDLDKLIVQFNEAIEMAKNSVDYKVKNTTLNEWFESVQETAVPDTLVSLLPQCALDIVEICEKINALGRAVVFLGDGVPVYQQQIKNYMKMPYHFAPASCNRQRAASVAALGACLYAKGVYQTAAEHAPEYLRQSQAERERNESKNHKV